MPLNDVFIVWMDIPTTSSECLYMDRRAAIAFVLSKTHTINQTYVCICSIYIYKKNEQTNRTCYQVSFIACRIFLLILLLNCLPTSQLKTLKTTPGYKTKMVNQMLVPLFLCQLFPFKSLIIFIIYYSSMNILQCVYVINNYIFLRQR